MATLNFLEVVEDFKFLPSNMKNLPLAEKIVKEFKKSEGVEHKQFCNEAGFKSILSNLLAEFKQTNIHLKLASTGHGLEFLSLQVRY